MADAIKYEKGQYHPFLRYRNWTTKRSGALSRLRKRLDEDLMIARARRKVGWDDFGSEHFREPLRVLLDAAAEDGLMTFIGARIIYAGGMNALCTRLRTQREIHLHPDILQQPVKRPLIIVGAPRTGTTLLNHLLSQDPVSRPLLGWESIRPAPMYRNQKRGAFPRRLRMEIVIAQWLMRKMSPDLCALHPFSYDLPDECHWLFWPSFVFPPTMAIPSVRSWLKEQPESIYDHAYADYRLALQLLEWHRPARGHWVLKSPLHLWALDAAARAVPEASFIQTHRSLDEVIPSFCSLAALLMDTLSNRVDPKRMGPIAIELAHETIERFTRARESIDPMRIMDLPFAELVGNPIDAVRRIYDRFGYEYTPEFEDRMQGYLAEEKRQRAAQRKHEYAADQFNLDRDAIMKEFASYHQEYGLA